VSIEDTLKLRAGENILIHGGAGGVAGFAIQLAKHLGARVISTASAANHEYVRGLGADVLIDYRKQDFAQLVSGCDAVFDTAGGDVAARSFAVLVEGAMRLPEIAVRPLSEAAAAHRVSEARHLRGKLVLQVR
jgi:NADPH:quinone reductase-like Zn-dependent oxidoreductase